MAFLGNCWSPRRAASVRTHPLAGNDGKRKRWGRLARALCLISLAASGAALAQDPAGTGQEYAVKAAFVYNFAKFTEWPDLAFADERAPVLLCIVGENRFTDHLTVFADKSVHGRSIAVREATAQDDLSRCHIAYFTGARSHETSQALQRIATHSVLAIGEDDAFLRDGGLIALSVVDNKIVFRVSIHSLQRSGLTVSSKLLRLADIYEQSR